MGEATARAKRHYAALGDFSDLVDLAERHNWFGWRRDDAPGDDRARWAAAARQALGPRPGDLEYPISVRTEQRFRRGGIDGEVVSWDAGFGPRSVAYVLRPAGVDGPLPGVVALHCHGGFKYYGKDKIADGPNGAPPEVAAVRDQLYGGVAYANLLAEKGYVVLVPDAFGFGSRRVSVAGVDDDDVAGYNAAAVAHEHVVEKHCRLLGTSFGALVAREDRIAAAYLQHRSDVAPGGVGCIGLSGGGFRAGALHATCPSIVASVVVAMMSSYAGLIDDHVAGHTWMLYPDALPVSADWPEVVGSRTDIPLFVQYAARDELFSREGMDQADRILGRAFAAAGRGGDYTGRFYPVPHSFDQTMQADAFSFLAEALGTRG